MLLTIVISFFVAYAIMMPLVAIHLMFNWKVLGYEGYTTVEQLKTEGPRVEAYKKTVPWQPLYNIVVFGIISIVLFRGLAPIELLMIGLIWLALAIVSDLLTWIIIPHPWRMSFRELYVGHQPWITLCYVFVVASPFLALL